MARGDRSAAMMNYQLALSENSANESALFGIDLCVYANGRPDIAAMIFELFITMRAVEPQKAIAYVSHLLQMCENEEFQKSSLRPSEWIDMQNGIAYDDFKRLLAGNENFAAIYEKVVWSTNVFISRKRDWFDFVNKLIDSGYTELAYNYIESASPLWGSESRTLIEKLRKKEQSAI